MKGRETFGTRLGVVATMIGVAVGLGNVWRFPYMVGRYGGASFVAIYALTVALIGVPALMAEWSLGRHTRRGPVGAFKAVNLPFGGALGWYLFFVVAAATGYYTNAIGWVLYYAVGELAQGLGLPWSAGAILPPDDGVDKRSFFLQLGCSAIVLGAVVVVLRAGIRKGIERVSRVIIPLLFATLALLIVRALTLPGAGKGVDWYILKIDLGAVTPAVVVAAMGQAIYSLSLGGSFMVVYGSYLADEARIEATAIWTALGDLGAGLLAGLAILPAVFALGLAPSSGPGLIFSTLPGVFAEIPFGRLFGLLFFLGLLAAAYLSDIAAIEVLVAGLTDNTRLTRNRAIMLSTSLVFVLAIPPMINMRIFIPWDLTFGSGMQVLGALMTVVAVGWCMKRTDALRQLGGPQPGRRIVWLYAWLRYFVPAAVLLVGIWWLLSEVLGVINAA